MPIYIDPPGPNTTVEFSHVSVLDNHANLGALVVIHTHRIKRDGAYFARLNLVGHDLRSPGLDDYDSIFHLQQEGLFICTNGALSSTLEGTQNQVFIARGGNFATPSVAVNVNAGMGISSGSPFDSIVVSVGGIGLDVKWYVAVQVHGFAGV